MQRRDTQTLQVLFLEIWCQRQIPINDAHSDVQSLIPHLKLVMNLGKPIDQIGSHLLCDFSLLLDEVVWQDVLVLILQDELCYSGCILGHTLDLPQI